ncbi:General stress protein 69 [Anaerohalosphaera lusitana]|uniref:General stress protein 69 n=1 Tax=Anaerohalosphaera lusitana TaxID=1936003 RepID=A0A1U9NJ35_9BACT|nr:aldo/keto reductase [Anaerohalosphaera lusitana]AQT67600.1 General stress protein 69 [Anaerohalosphaera lusitana]
MERRDFLKRGVFTTGLLTMDNLNLFADPKNCPVRTERRPGFIPKRQYGKTDLMLSVIGFGGIVVMGHEQNQANRIVAEAFERGVNYYDVAPSYGDTEAETKLGPALQPYRDRAFLACKTTERTYAGAKEEFEASLKRLKTDHFDLYQLHAITDVEKDVDAAFAEDGVMKLLREEKKNGRIRYLGFSAHSHAAALAAMDRFDFDSVLFPVNFAGYLEGGFSPEVIEKAREKQMAILALKMLARQRAPKEDPVRRQYPKCWYQPITDPDEAKLAMAFTLSQPVTAAIPPGHVDLFRMALDAATELEPVTEQQMRKLKSWAAELNPIFSHEA